MDSAHHDLDFQAPGIEELQPLFPAYEIGGFIAQGGMGAVYAARQISLDRPVAIKILPRQFGADPQFRASFEAEAKAMARLNHPNLIGVFDFGDVDGLLYIVMELVEGKSLHHSAHGKQIDPKEAARIVAGICRGLSHAHQAGILHRDIKPGNILLGPGAVPKIGDFGLARPVGADHNPDEIVWGTPGYSAPEILHNPEMVDARTDIFAVGVLLYELLTARIPSDPWQPPSTLSGCSPEFDRIIRRATHPSPAMRYASADEIADELDGLIKKLSGGMVRRTVTPPAATAPASLLGVRHAQPMLPSSKAKSGPMVVVALLVGLVAIAGILIASSRKTNRPTAAPIEEPSPPPKDPGGKPKPKPKPEPPVTRNERPKPTQPDKPTPPPVDPEPDKPAPPVKESLTQALARLKSALRKGNFAELPEGTAPHGNSHYLLVTPPLPWQAALFFAEDHGAQLAVLETREDLAWAVDQFKLTTPTWLGLSDSGTESKWFWANGSPLADGLWAPGQPDDTPSQDDGEDFGALLPGPLLTDLSPGRDLPFLLQWSAKGANPGSLTAQIDRVGEALKNKKPPVFPTGTRNIKGSRFLLVPRAVSWEETSALATAVGGHLAVPSSADEAAWITDTLQRVLGGGDGCWVGGRLGGVANPLWNFVTGEKFDFITWAPGQPDETDEPQPFLQVWRGVDGQFGYNNASNQAGQANYFLLEWSAPSRRNMPSKAEANRPTRIEDWLLAQRQETADREQAAYLRFKRRHDKNLNDFIADIKSETETMRTFSKEVSDYVDAFTKNLEEAGEIPAKLDNERAERVIGEIHQKALKKQTDIWNDYQVDYQAAKARYLADVQAELERRQRQGDRNGAAYLTREIAAAAEDAYFRQILGGIFPPLPEEEPEEEE